MAAKLHQILAAERGVSTETERLLTMAGQGLGVVGEQSPLSGLSRTYEPRQAEGENSETFPAVSQKVQVRVETDVMPMVAEAFSKILDLRYTRDEANTRARADVVVRGKALLKNVPTTQLLSLETSLGQLRGVINAFPVLDQAEEWEWDKNTNAHKGQTRRKTRSVNVPQVQVLYAATKEHPAQVRPYETQKPVGEWVETKFSGAMPAEVKEAILRRLAEIQTAVKFAREEANRIDVEQMKCGEKLFDFLYKAELPSA